MTFKKLLAVISILCHILRTTVTWARPRIHAARRMLYASIPVFLFLNAWENTHVACAMTSVFLRNTRWRHGRSWGETKYTSCLPLIISTAWNRHNISSYKNTSITKIKKAQNWFKLGCTWSLRKPYMVLLSYLLNLRAPRKKIVTPRKTHPIFGPIQSLVKKCVRYSHLATCKTKKRKEY